LEIDWVFEYEVGKVTIMCPLHNNKFPYFIPKHPVDLEGPQEEIQTGEGVGRL
jgi:hypothetical protein